MGRDDEQLPIKLEGADLEPYLSDYLMRGGLLQDVPEIDRIDVTGSVVEATWHMRSWFVSRQDGKFHLSGLVASVLLVQVGIVHGLVLEGRKRKSTEIYMSDYQIKLHREITATSGVKVRMEKTHRIVLPASVGQPIERSFCSWRFDVGDGAWRGKMTLMFPLHVL
jgi:hypothetical protein